MRNGLLDGKRIFVGFDDAGTEGIQSFTRVLKRKGLDIDFYGFDRNPFGVRPDITIRWWRPTFLRKFRGLIFLLSLLPKYDIFHIYFARNFVHYEIDNFIFKIAGKKVIYDFRGSDVFDVEKSVRDEGKSSPYYHFYQDRGPRFFKYLAKKKKFIIEHADQIILAGPWLVDSVSRYDSIIPYSRDIDQIGSYKRSYSHREFTILHASTNSEIKGSKYLSKAIDELRDRGLKVRLINPDRTSREELFDLINRSDVVVDQLLLGWYGGFAVEAMALEKPVICFIKEEYKKLVPFGEDIPIIEANKDNVGEVVEKLMGNRNKLKGLGKRGYEFVKKFHDAEVIAQQYEDIYNKVLGLYNAT